MTRFNTALNLHQYSKINLPLKVGAVNLDMPKQDQYVLRMLVQSPTSNGLQLPDNLLWLKGMIKQAEDFQDKEIGIKHPYTYVTVRKGNVLSTTDDMWHVDGFSMKYSHLPESNYIVTFSEHTTEYVAQRFYFPVEFNPLKHNIHTFFQNRIISVYAHSMLSGIMYFIDPYVVHRRPPQANGDRTFIRISFTPIEIPDKFNTVNPYIDTNHYILDGVSYRDQLSNFDL